MENRTIYLADDDPDDRDIFRLALEEICSDFNLAAYSNGRQLIDQLVAPHAESPDVIFLDVNMPLKNGIEALSDIRSNPGTAQVPIIMYSTSNDPHLVKTSQSLGANLYLVKPSDFSKLKKLLAQTLSINWNTQSDYYLTNKFMIT